jgi:adenylate kinase family enzyme
MKISQLSKLKISRIHIIGDPASGKTYLAKLLSKKLKIKHYDLDDITHRKDGSKRDKEERRKLLHKVCVEKRWIIEGAYTHSWISEALKKSNVIIWLDLPIGLTALRLIKRESGRRLLGRIENRGDFLTLFKYLLHYKTHLEDARTLKPLAKKIIRIKTGAELKQLINIISQ